RAAGARRKTAAGSCGKCAPTARVGPRDTERVPYSAPLVIPLIGGGVMPLDLNDTDAAVYNNALFLAWASDLAYLEGGKGREEFQRALGLDATFFSVGNTQAYVAHDANHIVLAFRGTEAPTSLEGFKDWLLTDANNFLILPE